MAGRKGHSHNLEGKFKNLEEKDHGMYNKLFEYPTRII